MGDNLYYNLVNFLKNRIPIFSTFVLIFMFYVPINSDEVNCFRPMVSLICVYYWSIFRHNLFSYTSAFFVGFITDIYSSTPLGLNILIMLVTVLLINYVMHYIKSFSFIASWQLFIAIGFVITMLKWLIYCVYYKEIISIKEIILNLFSTIMFYPLITYINNWIKLNYMSREKINE